MAAAPPLPAGEPTPPVFQSGAFLPTDPGHGSGADPTRGPTPLCQSGLRLRISYLSTPKSAPQSWVSMTVPMIGPKPLEKPVRLRTWICGRGLSVG